MDVDITYDDTAGVRDNLSHRNALAGGEGPPQIYEEISDFVVESPQVGLYEEISDMVTDDARVQDENRSALFSLYLTSSSWYVYSQRAWDFNPCHIPHKLPQRQQLIMLLEPAMIVLRTMTSHLLFITQSFHNVANGNFI